MSVISVSTASVVMRCHTGSVVPCRASCSAAASLMPYGAPVSRIHLSLKLTGLIAFRFNSSCTETGGSMPANMI